VAYPLYFGSFIGAPQEDLLQALAEDQAKDRGQAEDRAEDQGQVEDRAKDLAEDRGPAEDRAKDRDQVGDQDQAGDQAEDQGRAEDQDRAEGQDQAEGLARDQDLHHKVLPLGQHKSRPISNSRRFHLSTHHRRTSCSLLCLVHCSQFTRSQPYTFCLQSNLRRRREVY